MLNREERAAVAGEVQVATPNIVNTTSGASNESIYYSKLLPPLDRPEAPRSTRVHVLEGDTFTVARNILPKPESDTESEKSTETTAPQPKVAVLNMASEKRPGGGWLRGALAQEEALCFRSTLAATLKDEYYPLQPLGAVWSSGVVVFRGEIAEDCRVYEEAEEHIITGVVSVAGLRHPKVVDGDYANATDAETMRDKIRQMLRVLGSNSITHCVLGALGCGVFKNPPKRVAQLFREIITDEEFRGHFDEVVFAILDPKREGNLAVFEEVIGDFAIDGVESNKVV